MEQEFIQLPFDLETAQAHPEWLYTRCGTDKARILCADLKGDKPIVAALRYSDGIDYEEYLMEYYADGRYYDDEETGDDLVLRKPITRCKAWVVTYREHITVKDEIYYSYKPYGEIFLEEEKAQHQVTLFSEEAHAQFHEIEIEEE